MDLAKEFGVITMSIEHATPTVLIAPMYFFIDKMKSYNVFCHDMANTDRVKDIRSINLNKASVLLARLDSLGTKF